MLTNTYLTPIKVRPHTIRYEELYSAYIDGIYINTPGIDSAIYAGQIDFRIQNTSKHPIILVMNYDGSYAGKEEVFTLGYPSDKGGIEFIRQQGNCFIREINNEKVTRCYNAIKK